MYAKQMLDAYPAELPIHADALAQAIEAASACAQACIACSDACLSEQDVGSLTRCIRDDLDCADVCTVAARVLSRHTGYDVHLTRAVVQACIQACGTCADSCGEHRDHHRHCAICEQACRDCKAACMALLGELQPSDVS
jgi:hypothetical protein